MKNYKATIELEFESNLDVVELLRQMQVCLVELDLRERPTSITLDNIESKKFMITDYTQFQIHEIN